METLFLKKEPKVTGYYELESEKNMKNFIEVAMPAMREKFDAMVKFGIGMRLES